VIKHFKGYLMNALSLENLQANNVALVVISHHEAHIHRINFQQGQPESLDSVIPEEIRNYLSADTNRQSHYGDHEVEDQQFYRTVIDSVKDTSCVFVYGDGMGRSSAEHHLEESINQEFPDCLEKFVFLEYAGHPTDKQILIATQNACSVKID